MMASDRRDADRRRKGLVAGAVGVAARTLGEKVEQAFTHHPDAFVPPHTRLTADHTQENITGVGAPPWTWPRAAAAQPGSFSGRAR
jgi:hypothetical protein